MFIFQCPNTTLLSQKRACPGLVLDVIQAFSKRNSQKLLFSWALCGQEKKKKVIQYNERERSEELSNFEIKRYTRTWILCHCQNYMFKILWILFFQMFQMPNEYLGIFKKLHIGQQLLFVTLFCSKFYPPCPQTKTTTTEIF